MFLNCLCCNIFSTLLHADMSYLRFVKKGTKEVSQVPPNVSAGGSIGEGTGENAEVASRPPIEPQSIDVDLIPDVGKKRAKLPPPATSIGARLKRAREQAAAEAQVVEESSKKTRASSKKHKKAASARDASQMGENTNSVLVYFIFVGFSII